MTVKVQILETRRSVNRPAAMLEPAPFILLTAQGDVEVEPGEFGEINTAVGLRIPKEYMGRLYVVRPIASRGLLLINGVDLITPGDEAEIVLPVKNIGKEKAGVEDGEPVAMVLVERTGIVNVSRITRPVS